VGSQQCLHLAAQILVAAARIGQKRGAILKRELNSVGKDSYFATCIVVHGIPKAFCGRSIGSAGLNKARLRTQ
jgi:hypothetical protein